MRNVDAPEFFENFMISAVAAILTIRVFLHLSGYPTVGGESLHIAHMLWGGLLMLAALLMLLGFLGQPVKAAAAVVGGIGWGTFIDELGKFLTHDNNYFFEPTFALIYVIFVLLYVVWDALHSRTLTRQESLANALELMLEAVRSDMDPEERQRALDLLASCDPDDPVVRSMATALANVELVEPGRPGPLARARSWARLFYRWIVRQRWFPTGLIVFFIAHSANALIQAAAVVRQVAASVALLLGGLLVAGALLHPGNPLQITRLSVPAALAVVGAALLAGAAAGHQVLPALSFFEWAELLSSVVPTLLILVGIARLRRSRLEAYQTFKTAILILIFVTQFFTFYHQQLLAVLGLAVNIVIWVTLRSIIQQEERLGQGTQLHGERV
jgi:hypothetical protein